MPDALLPVCLLIVGAATKSLFNRDTTAKRGYQCSQERLLPVELQKSPQPVHAAARMPTYRAGYRARRVCPDTQLLAQRPHTQSHAYGKQPVPWNHAIN